MSEDILRDWTKKFYTKQYQLLDSVAAWGRFFPADPPGNRQRRAEAVERLAGPGVKRVLELGCGGGLTAGAIALLGHHVVAVDIVETAAASARRIAAQLPNGAMRVVQGDFYQIELDDTFDVVCYFDGFGIGSDADQRRLLRRIAGWLNPQGCALIDVYNPWYFGRDNGEAYQEGQVMYRSDFDAAGCRLEETLWPVGDESQAVTQSLRCYSPADLRLLLEGSGLALHSYEPYDSGFQFDKQVPLKEAAIYLAHLLPEVC